MGETADFEVYVNDELVASASGPRETAKAEAMNYARQYSEDGLAEVYEVSRTLIAVISYGGHN